MFLKPKVEKKSNYHQTVSNLQPIKLQIQQKTLIKSIVNPEYNSNAVDKKQLEVTPKRAKPQMLPKNLTPMGR